MTAPRSPDSGISFDLGAVGQQLTTQPSFASEGQAARTLIRSPDLRIVVVALRAGKTISEHQAAVTASVQTLAGHVRLKLADRTVDLPTGKLLVLGVGLSHDVYAETDSVFLLTLGWTAKQ